MSAETVDLAFIGRMLERILGEQPAIRSELHEQRQLALLLSDKVSRLDRRLGETRDDLELIIKSEIMGRLAHFETRQEVRLSEAIAELRRELGDEAPTP